MYNERRVVGCIVEGGRVGVEGGGGGDEWGGGGGGCHGVGVDGV